MKDNRATDFVASYVIFEKDNKVAFVLRSNTTWMDGYYGLPSGKVDVGEGFLAAAVREAYEEVGVEIKSQDLEYVHTMHRHAESDWVDVYFVAKNWKGELINAEPHLHAKLEWLDLDNLPDNIVPVVRAALESIKKGETYSEFGW